MSDLRTMVVDGAAVASAGCVVILTVLIVRQASTGLQAERSPIEVSDWQTYAEAGHRRGSDTPLLTVIEFGDYECPACRQFEPVMKRFLREHSEEVAFVYRHWPLTTHRYSYDAARAAECAGVQGRFWAFHDRLYQDARWINNAFLQFAKDIGVPDLNVFSECIDSADPVPAIESDVKSVRALGAFGTPALIVNGTLLARIPSLEELERMLEDASDQPPP